MAEEKLSMDKWKIVEEEQMCMMQRIQLIGPKFCELQHSALPFKSLLETLSECASPPDIHHPTAMLL